MQPTNPKDHRLSLRLDRLTMLRLERAHKAATIALRKIGVLPDCMVPSVSATLRLCLQLGLDYLDQQAQKADRKTNRRPPAA